jgi:hypothetical protein
MKQAESRVNHVQKTWDLCESGVNLQANMSLLSPVITSFFMEDLGEVGLDQATHKPLYWFYYVDDTVVTWPHRLLHKLKYFLNHLNCVHQNIYFTLERERWPHFLPRHRYLQETSWLSGT